MAEPSDFALTVNALVISVHATGNRDLFAAIASSGLTLGQLRFLERLRSGRVEPTIRQAAKLMSVEPPHASRVVNQLAERGYIERTGDENDSRRRRILITPAGRRLLLELHALRLDAIEDWAEPIDQRDRAELERVIRRILHLDDPHDHLEAVGPGRGAGMNLKNAVKLDAGAGRGQVEAQVGSEWLKARCGVLGCPAHWSAVGHIDCQRKLRQIQKHADRYGHAVEVQYANARGGTR